MDIESALDAVAGLERETWAYQRQLPVVYYQDRRALYILRDACDAATLGLATALRQLVEVTG